MIGDAKNAGMLCTIGKKNASFRSWTCQRGQHDMTEHTKKIIWTGLNKQIVIMVMIILPCSMRKSKMNKWAEFQVYEAGIDAVVAAVEASFPISIISHKQELFWCSNNSLWPWLVRLCVCAFEHTHISTSTSSSSTR